MKKSLRSFALLMLMMLFAMPLSMAGTLDGFNGSMRATTGDVNGDGRVDVDDVTALVSSVLGNGEQTLSLTDADVNSDGRLDVDDITKLVNDLLNAMVLTEGEWAYLANGVEPAMAGQATNDHLFVRMEYNGVTVDDLLEIEPDSTQAVWFWLDDEDIYNNDRVQALKPVYYDMDEENRYKEITYNCLQVDLYLPMGFVLTTGLNLMEHTSKFDWGERMPFDSSISTYNRGTIVVDGATYNHYRVLLTNTNRYGCHLSAMDEYEYEEHGALRKDDRPLFALFIKNNNQEPGGQADMILANLEFSFREGLRDGWDVNDYKFFYGTGGNNVEQRFQRYYRVAIHY